MSRPERQQNVLDLLKELRGIEPLKKLFWSELNYQRVNQPLSRRGWTDSAGKALADDPVLFASGGENNDFHVIYCRLASDKLLPGNERPVVSRLLNEHPYTLFVFSNAAKDRWHFLNVKYDEAGDKRRLFRRITVGREERLRTASERISLLSLEVISPDVFGISPLTIQQHHDNAFDKEALTDEFFRSLDKHIRAVETDLGENHGLEPQDAFREAQLLIERLVFLYFAQNRGWLDQDSEYLIKKFGPHRAKPDLFSYYSEVLHLLFKSLAEPSFGNRLVGIPFLNGGLFDDDEFKPDSSKFKIRNSTFASLFDQLLETYNFTVREDTPLDQEVAVDPEMLGKIFESIVLHAESAGEEFQAPDKRKATGSYYTPRIVVHFICRESLRLYFVNRAEQLADDASRDAWPVRISRLFKEIESDDGFNETELKTLREILSPPEAKRCLGALNHLRTLDPAVGSGAFPVGLLHELVSLRRLFECAANGYKDPVKGEGDTWKQKTKEHFIQNSLFGVDIQQQAIEICRLRLWLSLLVDYELGVNPFEAERGKFIEAIARISQLPNLEMNFRRGDSLHDYICGHPVRLDGTQLADYTDDLALIEKKGEQLHHAKRADTRKKLRLEILSRRLALGKRVVTDQIAALQRQANQIANVWFGESASETKKRRKLEQEITRLRDALKQLEKDEKEFKRLESRPLDKDFYRNLRKLEGAEPDGPHNFVWRLDFPHVLAEKDAGTVLDNLALVNEAGQGELIEARRKSAAGFDLIVGNPPFVTARNPEKRELYRERWPGVCEGKYLLVCPFFELSFGLLKSNGQLGFIVSNAFAKREFGRSLVENFFPSVDLQKVVDCSGLLFPGHGTPTYIVLGASNPPDIAKPIRLAMTLPGGGDLRAVPEESPLWHSLAMNHEVGMLNPLSGAEAKQGFRKLFEDIYIAVGDCDRKRIFKHPAVWSFFDWPTFERITNSSDTVLGDIIEGDVGVCTMTNCDEVFPLVSGEARRFEIGPQLLRVFQEGEDIKNWILDSNTFVLTPYDDKCEPIPENKLGRALAYLRPYKEYLEDRLSFGNKTFKELGRPWFSFERMNANKYTTPLFIAFGEISTHGHFSFWNQKRVYKQTCQTVKLPPSSLELDFHSLAGVLNSSTALFWLKQVCFNKGAGEDEHRDRFVFAGTKVQPLPIPTTVAEIMRGKTNTLAERLTALSRTCWERGRELPSLAFRKLFEKSGEAYHAWNAALPGHVAPQADLGAPFTTTAELKERFASAVSLRDRLRAEMVARQEEMDWLVYVAYGLLAADHPAVQIEAEPPPLDQSQRPFRLWESAGGDFAKASALIPADWPNPRRALWEGRLSAIRDNEHVRRIEQPVYKRRWDEQWKVSNRWIAGPVAYAQELADAFRWWLAEKAEWLLENKAGGGPVELSGWTTSLWRDKRIEAAWPVVAEAILTVERWKNENAENSDGKRAPELADGFGAFGKLLKETVADETVRAGIPPAVPWDDLAAKKKWTPAQLKKAAAVRGKLNVPRERFQQQDDKQFVWAGNKK